MPHKSVWGDHELHDSDSDQGPLQHWTELKEEMHLEKPDREPNISRGVKQAIFLPCDALSEKGYIFIHLFHGGQDSVPALLLSLTNSEYVVRKYPQHFDYVSSHDIPREGERSFLRRTEVHINKKMGDLGLSPKALHPRDGDTNIAHMSIEYCNGGTTTAYFQSLAAPDERQAFLYLLLATAIRSFAYMHHGVILPILTDTMSVEKCRLVKPEKWNPILHSDAHTSNFFVHFASPDAQPDVMIADFSRSRYKSQTSRTFSTIDTSQDDFRSFLLSIGTCPPLSGEFPSKVKAGIQMMTAEVDAGKSALDFVEDGTFGNLLKRYRQSNVRLGRPEPVETMPLRVRGQARKDKLRWRDATSELDEMGVEWSWRKLK